MENFIFLCSERNKPIVWSAGHLQCKLPALCDWNIDLKWFKKNSRSQMFFRIGVLKIYNIRRYTPVLESPFNKVAGLQGLKLYSKETPA